MTQDLTGYSYIGKDIRDPRQPSSFYTGAFGLGGNQTTYDTGTKTYSQNKDSLVAWLYKNQSATVEISPDWKKLYIESLTPPPSVTPPVTPLPTAPPANLGGYDNQWKDVDTFVAYYECSDPKYPCPTESRNPDFKIISKTLVATGSHGGCSSCMMTEIVWQRRVPTVKPPLVTPPITPPAAPCQEGTTRSVKCPKTQQMITQQCVNGAWVTIKADEKKCAEEDYTMWIVGIIAILIIIYFLRK